jgi:pyridoxal phosphate enzyme (YggS family)
MSEIAQNLECIKTQLPIGVELVAVSKTKPIQLLQDAYDAGQRVFGENRVPEMVEKSQALPQDIEWHMIGHLQRNKVKMIAPFVTLIHAVDSLRLLAEIDKEAKKNNRVIRVLLQFHIAQEQTKYGLDIDEARELLRSERYRSLQNIEIAGVMGMATFTDDEVQIRTEFKSLKSKFDTLKSEFFSDQDSFREISMGMSGDYMIAVEEGSTMVRIGSSIFGSRSQTLNL